MKVVVSSSSSLFPLLQTWLGSTARRVSPWPSVVPDTASPSHQHTWEDVSWLQRQPSTSADRCKFDPYNQPVLTFMMTVYIYVESFGFMYV